MAFGEPTFELREHELDVSTTVIAVAGELHVSTAPDFKVLLERALGPDRTAVVIDLSEVSFIDSTGLSVLLGASRQVTHRNGRLALVCSNPTVLRLFEITRLDETFDIQPDVETALARVRGTATGRAS